MKYMKRPQIVTVARYEGDSFDFDYFFDFNQNSTLESVPLSFHSESGTCIQTPSGIVELNEGDYIVRNENGEFDVYDPITFELFYQKVDEG